MPRNFVLGVLVNNVWSVAGSGSRTNVNQMLLQYFINYNMKKGWYLTTQPILTANWNTTAASGNVWTMPVWWGLWENHETGNATGEHQCSGLWQCRAYSATSPGRSSNVRVAVP